MGQVGDRDTGTSAGSGTRRHVERLKRDMLRAAVDENLATIEGRGPARPRRPLHRSWLWWTPVTFLAVLALVESLGSTTAPPSRVQPGPASTPNHVAAAVHTASAAGSSNAEAPRVLGSPRSVEPSTFHLAVHRVVVDPGHGGTDPGALASGMREKDVTVDIARRVRAQLESAGFEVVLTREADKTVPLVTRVQAANEAHGDLFLCIHVNSIPEPEKRGVETYFLGTTTDKRVEALSGTENAGSGYSLADFRKLLEGVLLDVRLDESRQFGLSVQKHLFAQLQRWNPALQDRGVKQAPFVVLVGTEMPAVLAEVSCLSNPEDVQLLRDANYRESIANALAEGVRDFATTFNRPKPVGPAARGPM